MRVAVVFDTPNPGWGHDEFMQEMAAHEDEAEYDVGEALLALGHDMRFVGVHDDLHRLVEELDTFAPDLVFNCAEAFHGEARLDYLIPAALESEGWPYTGSPPMALLLTRNKALSKKVLAHDGIRVPRFTTCRPGEPIRPPADVPFPLMVKPVGADASEGIAHASVVQDVEQLAERVGFVHGNFGQPAIVEEFIEGRELYVSVIGNGETLEILPIVELVFDKERNKPEERIATRAAKWDVPYRDRRGIRNVFARPIAAAAREQIDAVTRTAVRALHLRDYARLDLRLTPDDEVCVIEVNANPFISFGHDTANAAEKAGLDYYAFIGRLLEEARARYAEA